METIVRCEPVSRPTPASRLSIATRRNLRSETVEELRIRVSDGPQSSFLMVSSWPGEMSRECEPAFVTLSSLASTIFPLIRSLPTLLSRVMPSTLRAIVTLMRSPLSGLA